QSPAPVARTRFQIIPINLDARPGKFPHCPELQKKGPTTERDPHHVQRSEDVTRPVSPASRTTLALLVAASAAAAIVGALLSGEWRWLHYVFKPLTTLMLLWIALRSPSAVWSRYRKLIIAGLALSVAGDIFLMLPGDWFVPGLVSFLLAHVPYASAF